MADGFRVDLGALEEAAEGINRTLAGLLARKVNDLGGREADYGHAALASTVADYCARWERGVAQLAKDGQAIAGQLSRSVQAYLRVEGALTATMDGILQRADGPDPGAR